jgi:hypothetical protein
MTTSEGSSHVVHEHSRHILLFGGEDPNHDAVMRIGSLPGRTKKLKDEKMDRTLGAPP